MTRPVRKKNYSNLAERWKKAASALRQARLRNIPVVQGGHGCPVLVEGKRDRVTLTELGFKGPIELVNRGWPLEQLVAYLLETYGTRNESDNGPSVILLMDWDRTGGRLQRKLMRNMESLDMKIDSGTRKVLLECMKPESRTVEGLRNIATELVSEMDDF